MSAPARPTNMLAVDDVREIDASLRTAKIIWAGMLAMLVCYTAVALILDHVVGVIPMVAGPDDARFLKFGYVLYGIAAIHVPLVYVVRRVIGDPKGVKSSFNGSAYKKLASVLGDPFAEGKDGDVKSAIAFYKSGMVTCLGLSEAIGLYGFTGFILRADYLQLYILMGVAVAAFIFIWPKKQELVDLAARLEQYKQRIAS